MTIVAISGALSVSDDLNASTVCIAKIEASDRALSLRREVGFP